MGLCNICSHWIHDILWLHTSLYYTRAIILHYVQTTIQCWLIILRRPITIASTSSSTTITIISTIIIIIIIIIILLTNQNYVQAEIKCRKQEIDAIIQSKHSCLLDFFLRIWKLKYCQLCYMVVKSRLRVFENRILRRIFGPKRDENGEWRSSTMRNFIVCTVHLIRSEERR